MCYTDGEWETIWIPFEVTAIKDKEGTEVSYDLKELISSTTGLVNFNDVEDKVIKANTPYMIRFAEVEDAEQQLYTLYGTTTLYTTNDLHPITGTKPEFTYSFNGTYQTIDGEDLYMVTLNQEGTTVFGRGEAGSRLEPFSAYIEAVDQGTPEDKFLTIGMDNSTVDMASQTKDGFSVWNENGKIHFYSDQVQTLNIWSIDGGLIRSLQITEGYSSVAGLTKGIYIVNNHKVVIK